MRELRPILWVMTVIALLAIGALGWTHQTNRAWEESCGPLGSVKEGIHFLKRGSGPPIVFIHGAGANLREFLVGDLVDRLAEHYTIYLIDRPGAGHSEVRQSVSDGADYLQSQVDQIAEFVVREKLEPVVWIGHSLGGGIAAALAVQHPSLTKGLVILAGAVHPIGSGASWYTRLAVVPGIGRVFLRLVVPLVGPMLLPNILEANFHPKSVISDYSQKSCLDLIFDPQRFLWNARALNGIIDFLKTQRPRYSSIRVPVALLYGADDKVIATQVHSHEFKSSVPQSRLHMLENTGHLPHHSRPDLLIDEIRRVASNQ